jgi:uncharacterized protein (DUF58 family)
MLTKSGLGATIVAVVALVLGVWWRYEELVITGVVVVVAVAVSLWSARVAHAARIVRRVDTPRVARGEDLRITYLVSNPGRRRSTPATVVDRCDTAVAEVDVPAVEPNDRLDLRARLPTTRRGIHEVGPWRLERHDPFGLAVGRRSSSDSGAVIVHPRVHPLAGPYGAMHIIEHEAVIRRVSSDPLSGFVSLREYVQGDDPRMIHWPTTARMGSLMIREHVELRRPEFTVVLDTATDIAPPDDFEEMVDVVASVAIHAIRSGVDVRVRTTSHHHPGSIRSITHEQIVLDMLTPVAQAPRHETETLAGIFRAGLDHTAIVMITGPSGPAVPVVHHDSISVIRVGGGAALAPGIALAVDDAATFAQSWRPWH